MEGGVEGDHLRHAGKDLLHGVDAQKVGGIVQRGEVRAEVDLLENVIVHQHGAGEEVSTLHDTVAHRLNILERLEHTGFLIGQRGQDELHAHFVVRDGNVGNNLILAGGSILENTGGKADFLCDTLCDDIIHIVALHIQQLILDAGRAAVDYENDHKFMFVQLMFSLYPCKDTKLLLISHI